MSDVPPSSGALTYVERDASVLARFGSRVVLTDLAAGTIASCTFFGKSAVGTLCNKWARRHA